MTLPSNLMIVKKAGADPLMGVFREQGLKAVHMTNGIYAGAANVIVPTILAGFEYAKDNQGMDVPALFIAVNSDKSYRDIIKDKIALGNAKPADLDMVEDHHARALRVAVPVALQNPNHKVVVGFYDEKTPNTLLSALNKKGLVIDSLFKWGFGTKPGDRVIEGAEYARIAYGFPLPHDALPICYDVTRVGGQLGNTQAVDLRGVLVSADNKCLFQAMHEDLLPHFVRIDRKPSPAAAITPV